MVAPLDSLVMLAAEAAPASAPAAGQAPQNPLAGLWTFLPFLLILIGFFWFTARSQKKRDQERQTMLDGIRPKDDVVTIGGMRGRVVSISDEEVVLRVDDAKDVKITFSKSAIHHRRGEGSPPQ